MFNRVVETELGVSEKWPLEAECLVESCLHCSLKGEDGLSQIFLQNKEATLDLTLQPAGTEGEALRDNGHFLAASEKFYEFL